MAFSGLLPFVISGKADLAISDISITEERKKSVLFTDSYFIDVPAVIYRKSDFKTNEIETKSQTPKKENAIIAWIKTGIERNLLIDNRWKMITNGLGVTMLISIAAQFFGTIIGGFICYLLLRKNKLVKWFANRYCGIINGTPIVVLLMITYYIVFGSVDISNVLVAIVAFSIVMGAGVAQTLKGSIETVDVVEIEAARSIGFSAFKAFTTVTLPQAIRRALPAYTSGFVELVKSTAIVGYIAIQDLTRAGDIIRSRTYDAYFPLLLVALIYLIVTALCVWIFKYLIKKVNGEKV
jgi:polar amino acid transport system substrate-binding protein